MAASFGRIFGAGLPVLAGVLAGLAAGAVWTLAQPDRYRADARVLVRGTNATRVLPAVKAVAESSLLEQNVAQTLHISHGPRVSAKSGDDGILTVSVEAGSRDRSRQIDAEAVVVLIQKVAQRFGSTGVTATVLDPAHPAEQTSPTPERNLLIAGLIGLAAGAAGAAALARQRRMPMIEGGVDPNVERRLRSRVGEVTKRERALARRAGELAKREKQLERREEELAAAAARPAPSQRRQAEPEPEPVPVEVRELPPEVALEPAPGHWNLHALELLVREQGSADPSEQGEWNTYLFFLRQHANPDGSLPPSFDGLVNEVFGSLFDRGTEGY
jgi:hypothetical protein